MGGGYFIVFLFCNLDLTATIKLVSGLKNSIRRQLDNRSVLRRASVYDYLPIIRAYYNGSCCC